MDLWAYEYLCMPLCPCICAKTRLCLFNALLSHFLSLTGVLSDLCCLPHFEVKRTNCIWTAGKCYEFIIGARRDLVRQCCMELMLYSSSQACHWLGMNYSSFFYFFPQTNIDHSIMPGCITVGLYDSTPSEPNSSLSKTTLTAFHSLCPLQCIPAAFFQRIFFLLSLCLSLVCLTFKHLIETTFDGSLDYLDVEKAASAFQSKQL